MKSPHLLSFCSLVLFSYGVFAEALVAKNPPSKCKQGDPECTCETQQQVANSCIKVNLDLGVTTPWTGSQRCSLKVFADAQSPLVFTPESLYAVMGYTFKRIGNTLAADGITPKEVVFTHPNGEPVYFVFNDGESIARPDPGFHIKMDERLQMVDAEGWACTRNPVYYDLYETDGTVRRFVATDASNERGRLVSIMDCRGKVTTPADLGIDIVYGPDGVRQFLTPSRLADIAVRQDGYDVTVYPLASSPAKNPVNGRYVLPQGAPLETLSVRSANDGKRAVVTLRKGGGDSETYLFDYVRDDWSLTRPSGVEERHSRFIQDAEAARTVEETYSGAAELLSRDEYNYVWQSWGFAATNRVEGFGGIARTTTWEYYTSGNGKGQVRTEIRPTGLKTEYVYDASDRMITRRRSGPDMMTELTTCSYASVDPSDVVPPVDSRPRTVVKKLNGVECGRTYYVYSPLTNIVERVGTQGAAYGGTNALRTVTGFYPVVPDDIRSGMVRSVRHEDGRFDAYDYSLVTNVWTETVTHLHEQAMIPVSGKTTRDTRITNARGEIVEERSEAFIDGTWHVISRNRMTYNLQGKRIRVENLAGQITTTAWDCCHKISESKSDGRITTWDYDAEGRMIASSRLIPLDLTNVTWVTTCYAYDGLGRQTATWTTNFTEHIGIPATTTSYDALGRVVARADVLGNVTMTTYSPDGRTVSVRKPNGATIITTRNSDGDTISITGDGVTPEFYSRGVLADGTRWTKTVQGETADSPRFTKRYENMLGQTARSEKSGFRGTVIASVNTYDGYGRLVSTASDGEPTTTFTYDNSGVRKATISTVGADIPGDPLEWRKSELFIGYTVHNSVVWAMRTNVTSCSDANIRPLVTSRATQLTGLTTINPMRRRATDIRGNISEEWMEFVNGITYAKRHVPEATNIISSRSRFGVGLETISLSAVTNTTAYDPLGRVCTIIGGRANAKQVKYDEYGRKSETVDSVGARSSYAYDGFGNLVAVTNAVGGVIAYEYDLQGRKIYEGGAVYPVRYTYDMFGNKVSMTTYRDELQKQDSGDVTIWCYDEASNCLTNKVYSDGNGPKYDYDVNGNLTKRIWARGVETLYSYNAWGNLTNMTYSDSTPSISLSYDAMGRRKRCCDATGVTLFTYDAYDSVISERHYSDSDHNVVMERFWDGFGRSTGYSIDRDRQNVLLYDEATGALSEMKFGRGNDSIRWRYACGTTYPDMWTASGVVSSEMSYDSGFNVISVTNRFKGNLVSGFAFDYDLLGRVVSGSKISSTVSTNLNMVYEYRSRGDLSRYDEREDEWCTPIYDREWNFTPSGVRFVESIWVDYSRYFGVNQLNQTTNCMSFTQAYQIGYDPDGNQLNYQHPDCEEGALQRVGEDSMVYVEYDGENRPVTFSYRGTNVMVRYDFLGRREEYVRVISGYTNLVQRFMYDDDLCIKRVTIDDTGVKNDCYIWNPTADIATCPMVLVCDDERAPAGEPNICLYLHDGHKNVSDVVCLKSGVVAAHYDYLPTGTVRYSHGRLAKDNPWRFASEYADELGSIHYKFRHYLPSLSRWMTRDPNGEDRSGLLYVPYHNDLVNHFDYLGLISDFELGRSAFAQCEDMITASSGVVLSSGELTENELSDCNKELSETMGSQLVKDFMAKFSGSCKRPEIKCGCCANFKLILGGHLTKRGVHGYYSSNDKKIVFCWNNYRDSKNQPPFNMEGTLIHEMTHALQTCRNDAGGCLGTLKKEIETRVCAGQCDGFDDCFLKAVDSSCFRGTHCSSPKDVENSVAELKSWYTEKSKKDSPDKFCNF